MSSTPISRRWDWTSSSRTAAAAVGWTWRFRFNDNVYLFEFKVVEMTPKGAAMAQLKDKRYADKYRGLGWPIYLVAVEFSRDARNLTAFEVEQA